MRSWASLVAHSFRRIHSPIPSPAIIRQTRSLSAWLRPTKETALRTSNGNIVRDSSAHLLNNNLPAPPGTRTCVCVRLCYSDSATGTADNRTHTMSSQTGCAPGAPSADSVQNDQSSQNSIAPPAHVRGMTVLDREAFRVAVDCPCLVVDARDTGLVLKRLHHFLFNVPKIRNAIKDDSMPDKRIILLSSRLSSGDVLGSLPADVRTLVIDKGYRLSSHRVECTYDHFSADQVLRAVLPETFGDVTTSYDAVGHIAHMNLRDHQLPYKALIGQVMLDKGGSGIRTVVNKIGNIESTFRFFQMEVLAGDNDLTAEVHENGCKFRFDFSRVYWNSRLQVEHERIVSLLPPGGVLLDMCAGVGPFAVPAAKRGRVVYANDLNPSSHAALVANGERNRVGSKLRAFNMDARDFVRHVTAFINSDASWPAYTHVTMNLPSLSLELLSCFRGVFASLPSDRLPVAMPTILCHCFTSSPDPAEDVIDRAAKSLGLASATELRTLCGGEVEAREVRDVAPKKLMMCLAFRLPESVALAATTVPTTATGTTGEVAELSRGVTEKSGGGTAVEAAEGGCMGGETDADGDALSNSGSAKRVREAMHPDHPDASTDESRDAGEAKRRRTMDADSVGSDAAIQPR